MKKQVYILNIALSLLCFVSVRIPPHILWLAGFITYLIPFMLILNMVLLIRDLKNLRISFIVPLTIIILGWGFIRETISIHSGNKVGELKIMSFNVKAFNIYDVDMVKNDVPRRMAEWIKNQNSDILCIQEFYSESSTSGLNTIQLINVGNTYDIVNLPVYTNRIGAQFGNIIFSRYPIINSGQIKFDKPTQNQAIFADVIIHSDTVRIYDLHLQSLYIDDKELMNFDVDIEKEFRNLYSRMKFGFIQRSYQVEAIKKHILKCPYRIIVCGDFNDLPYSYTYTQLKDILKNSFVNVGKGLGFTYNGKLPFLRIDNQFFSNGVRAISFQTVKKMKYSDHFPIVGTYTVIDKSDPDR